MKKHIIKNSYFIYSITFLLLLPIVFHPFLSEGKTFVWNVDGLFQHFPLLEYYGKLLRGLISGKGFPMVDFRLGLGFDTLTTMSYYVLGDPISLLTVFMTPHNAVPFYDFLMLLRFYLAGISFIIFIRYWKKDGPELALGALIYVFCGYSLYACLRHPFFMNPMIYLPLLLVGVEKVLRGKKPYLMIIMTFISAVSNFYFFFDLTVITVIYIIFRYFTTYRKSYKNAAAGFFLTGLKTGGYYLIGTAMASFLLLPVIYAFSLNGRLGSGPRLITGLFHYHVKYYIKFYQEMYAGLTPSYWTILSFSSIIIVSLAILLCNKKYWKLNIAILMATAGLFIPAFGYMMNGFAYIANRWCFVLALLLSAAFTITYRRIFNLNIYEKLMMVLQVAIYGVFAYAFHSGRDVKYVFITLVLLMTAVLILQHGWFKSRRKISELVIYGLVILTLGVNGIMLYSPRFGNYAHQFLRKSTVESRTRQSVFTLLPYIRDDSFYRIGTYGDKALNASLINNYYGICSYYSLMDGDITSYLKDQENLSQVTAYRFKNFDNRTAMNTLASVKYLISTDRKAAPYGYKLINQLKSGSKTYYLYRNSYVLPLGYTYENYMLKADYDKLDALQKQNAMMKAVILDEDTNYADKTLQDMNSGISKITAKITPDSKVALNQNTIRVKQAGATITLNFKSLPNSETYVRLKGLKMITTASTHTNFYVKADKGPKKKINVRSMYYNNYFGKDNYLIDTGYSRTGEKRAVITFPAKHSYSYQDIEVYIVDMNAYQSDFQTLDKNTLWNIKQANNRIEGDTTLDKQGIMALSIPFSKGWSAYVDGTKVTPVQANAMYMALPLTAGSHHIVLKYETPYLKAGCIISVFAFIGLIGIVISNQLFRKKVNK